MGRIIVLYEEEIRQLIREEIFEAMLSSGLVKTPTPDLLTKKQAAHMLNVSISTLDALRRNGQLKTLYVNGSTPRIPREELQEYMKKRGG